MTMKRWSFSYTMLLKLLISADFSWIIIGPVAQLAPIYGWVSLFLGLNQYFIPSQ